MSCIWLELFLRCHLLTFPYEHWPESLGDFDSCSASKVQQDQQLVRLHQHLTMYLVRENINYLTKHTRFRVYIVKSSELA